MVYTDPIADYYTRIRNANMVRHTSLVVPHSKILLTLSQILKRTGLLRHYTVIEQHKQGDIRLFLLYGKLNTRVISGLLRISKPGLRYYVKRHAVPKVLNGLGIAIISTSTGVITDKTARAKNVGGTVLAYVW